MLFRLRAFLEPTPVGSCVLPACLEKYRRGEALQLGRSQSRAHVQVHRFVFQTKRQDLRWAEKNLGGKTKKKQLFFPFPVFFFSLSFMSSFQLSQLMTYERLRVWPPATKHPVVDTLPRAAVWHLDMIGKRQVEGNLNEYRVRLDTITATGVSMQTFRVHLRMSISKLPPF